MATAYYDKPTKSEFWNNIKELQANGAAVAFNVDALRLDDSLHEAWFEDETFKF